MAFLPQPDAEPIAGYRLVRRLGAGGFGEVWRVTAPGGLAKAIKIVFGHMQDARAEQELKALGRIKEVRHPFLLSLERYEVIDSQLFIVTELADMSLMERFEECKKSGLPGIPRDELLVYLRDAADALDYMSELYGLQHLDIKPQNLLLVGRRIKIADFGLVKDLQGGSATATGGVTPIYATPEAFDGRVSRYSDQYSLAIVYQEMLTGRRPFPGMTSLQLAAQHMSSPPMLDPLPQPDRAAIARALSKVPEERFPTCSAMVDKLLRAALPPTASTAVKVQSPSAIQRHNLVQAPRVPAPQVQTAPANQNELLNLATQVGVELSPKPRPRSVPDAAGPEPLDGPLVPPPAGEARLRPTLFLGIGGVAGWTLRRLKQRLLRRFGDLSRLPAIRLLLLDTDRSALRAAQEGEAGEALDAVETLLFPLRGPEHYRDQARVLLRWLDRRWLYNLPRSLLTEGARPLGRLALVDHAAELLTRLRETITLIASDQAKTATEAATGFGVEDGSPRVFIVASIAGATGGGMVFDLAYSVRQVLSDAGLSTERLCGILIHATSQRPAEEELARLNTYAGLNELRHYNRPDTVYSGDPEHGLMPFGPGVTPFEDCYLLHLGDQLGEAEADAATDPLAEYLFLNAASSIGMFFEQWRRRADAELSARQRHSRLRTFGLCRYNVPRHTLAKMATDPFCRQIVDRWCGSMGGVEEGAVEEEVLKQLMALGLDVEALTGRFDGAVKHFLGDHAETHFLNLLSDLPLHQNPPVGQASVVEASSQALGRIDTILGRGPDTVEVKAPERTALESSLHVQAEELRVELGQPIIAWLLTLVEQPQRRLKTASQAARSVVARLSAVVTAAGAALVEVRSNRAQVRTRVAAANFAGSGSGLFSLKTGRRQGAAESPKQKVVDYAGLRLREIVLENVLAVLRAVVRRVADFGRDLAEAHQRLGLFRETLGEETAGPPLPGKPPAFLPGAIELLPFGSLDLAEAARKLFKHIAPQLGPRFEETFQTEVLKKLGGLWGFLSGKGDVVQRVKEELRHRALAAILEATSDIDAAKLFLESHGTDRGKQELLENIAAVAPNLEVPERWQHRVVALPDSQAGATVRGMLSPALAEVPSTVIESEGDLVICHEVANLTISQMAAILIGDDIAYADAAPKIMTRVDVAWSSGAPSEVD